MNRLAVLVVVVAAVAGAGCADEPLIATFTSRVVQLESCKVVGEAPEGCSKDEAVSEVRNDLVEAGDDTFWLYGFARGSADDTALLGTRDTVGGFLFVDETVHTDASTGCVLTETLQLSLAVEAGREADVGADDCVSLVGREVDTTVTSAECDATSVPPQAIERTARRRWEPLDDSSTCGD